jgi:hypothetical protein
MSLHSGTFWIRANQSLLLLLNAACLDSIEATNTNCIVCGQTRPEVESTIYRGVLKARTLTITPLTQFHSTFVESINKYVQLLFYRHLLVINNNLFVQFVYYIQKACGVKLKYIHVPGTDSQSINLQYTCIQKVYMYIFQFNATSFLDTCILEVHFENLL